MAVGAAAGLAKHFIDKGGEADQRKVAQARAEGSWITGKDYQLPDRPNLIGNVMEGASMGANAGSAWDKMAASIEALRHTAKGYADIITEVFLEGKEKKDLPWAQKKIECRFL